MRENIYAIGSIPEYEHDGDVNDRYYLPARAVILGLNKPDSIAIVPDAPRIRAFVEDSVTIATEVQTRLPKTVLVPDTNYFLDLAIYQHQSTLEKGLSRDQKYSAWTYANTENLFMWTHELNSKGYNIEIAQPPKVYFENIYHPQHRGGWGRWVNDPDLLSFPERHGIKYPVSYIGRGFEELKDAYDRVVEKTRNVNVYCKPVFSAGGFSIEKIGDKKQLEEYYVRLYQEGALTLFGHEVPIEVQEEMEIKSFLSVQYNGEHIVTPHNYCEQVINGSNWEGNIFCEPEKNDFSKEIHDTFSRFVYGMNREYGPLQGWGGLDLVTVQRNGVETPYVLEHNGGRITGAHPAISLASSLGVVDRPFMMKKVNGKVDTRLRDVWKLLKREDCAFEYRNGGVFPLLWIEGSSFLFCSGENREILSAYSDYAVEILQREGFISQ